MTTDGGAAFRDIPDWQNSLAAENFRLLPSYRGAETLYFLLPRAVRLAQRADQSPDFALEFVSDINNPSPADSFYASLNLGLTREGEMQAASQFLRDGRPRASLIPATLATETYWCFEGKGIHESGLFAWEEGERARIYSRIPTDLGNLIYGALANSTSLPVVRAAIGCSVAAFLPRIESTVSFDPAGLIAALTALNPGHGSIPFQGVVDFFTNPPAGLITVAGDDRGDLGRSRGLTLAGHVRQYLGQWAPTSRISDGPHIALRSPSDTTLPTRMVWDLRTPLLALVPLLLDFDPFTPIVRQGGRDKVTSYTRVPPLPGDLLSERVVLCANLPPNILTHDAVDVTLRIAANLSRSGDTPSQTFDLYPPPGRPTVAELKFKRSTPKTYTSRIRAISDKGILTSEWVGGSGDYLYIGAENLPGFCVTLRASASLLSQARISAIIPNVPQTQDLVASLTEAVPDATFLLPAVNETARLIVTAQNPADAAQTVKLDLPCRSVALDLMSFPQYGPQTVHVTATFAEGVDSAEFEFLPEGSTDDPIVLRLTRQSPTGQWTYNATQLFHNRYRYRRLFDKGPAEPEWSDYRSPAETLKNS